MEEARERKNNLVDTTDCLEAIGVFKAWKNFLFIIVLLSLLLLQGTFWFVNTGNLKGSDVEKGTAAADAGQIDKPAAQPKQNQPAELKSGDSTVEAASEKSQISEAAKKVVAEANSTTPLAVQCTQTKKSDIHFGIKSEQLTWLIKFCNFVLILAAFLYSLTILFSLKISLLGRLGGIKHISRAFFFSLVMLLLLLPWQLVFNGLLTGVIYTPKELLSSCADAGSGMLSQLFLYLRFTVYWLVVILLAVLSQIRTVRWSRAILRRLEVI